MKGIDERTQREFSRIRKKGLLSKEGEALLSRRIRHSSNPEIKILARNILVERNMGFALQKTDEFCKKYHVSEDEIPDYLNEANYGLTIAADRFDNRYGYKFISYAVWWMDQSMKKYNTNHRRTIRLPEHANVQVAKLTRYSRTFLSRHGREPFPEELQEKFGFSIEVIDAFYSKTFSIDVATHDKDGDTLADTLESHDEGSDVLALRNNERKMLSKAMNNLTPLEQSVVRKYYGFEHKDVTLSEIARIHNYSPEHIRQLRNKALDKLRISLKNLGYDVPSPSSQQTEKHVNKKVTYTLADDSQTGLDSSLLELRHAVIEDYAVQLLTLAVEKGPVQSKGGLARLVKALAKDTHTERTIDFKSKVYDHAASLEEPFLDVVMRVYRFGSHPVSRLRYCLEKNIPLHNLYVLEHEMLESLAESLHITPRPWDFDDYVVNVASSVENMSDLQEYVQKFHLEKIA